MQKTFIVAGLVLVLGLLSVNSQGFQSSNLPIVIITTDNLAGIPNEPKIGATMKIIWHPDGTRNFVSDQDKPEFLNYDGRIAIEIRGSSSTILPKKGYGLETRLLDTKTANNVSILGMPSENDWILNGLAFDPSLLRDYLSYEMHRDMGHYAARSRYCEVILNGSYQGLYLIMEKLKGDKSRIDIHEMTKNDNTNLDVTGGYILKADRGEPVVWNMPGPAGITAFVINEPDATVITSYQRNYIMDQFMRLRDLTDSQNENIQTGYPTVIDVPNFIDFMLINEVSANVDGYQLSTYFYKDKGGKLKAGPAWDFNLTYGNDLFFWGLNRSFADTWQFDNGDNTGPFFWKRLFSAPTFKCYMARRWKQLTATGGPLELSRVIKRMDEIVQLTAEAAQRDNQKWGTSSDRTGSISAMKSWLSARYFWMSNQLSNSSACENPFIPPLVITKIHFNPAGDQTGDLEFIEITNTGQSTVTTAGLYFREPGMSYMFPNNGTIAPGQKIYLAANAEVFEQYYGIKPFGDFVRNLDNDSHYLVLVDAFGNVIDEVRYQDRDEWPSEADGAGAFLELKNTGLDNSLAASWVASSNCFYTVGKPVVSDVGLCQNEASTAITATALVGTSLRWYEDEAGTKLLASAPVPNTSSISTINYFVSSVTATGCESQKAKITVTVGSRPSLLQVTTDMTNPVEPVLRASESTGYQWYLNTLPIAGATTKDFTAYQSGSYQVAGVNNGCVGPLSLPIDLIVTGLDITKDSKRPMVFPNPSGGLVTVSFSDGLDQEFQLEVLDLTARILMRQTGIGSQAELNIASFPAGTYFLQIQRSQQKFRLKLIRGLD